MNQELLRFLVRIFQGKYSKENIPNTHVFAGFSPKLYSQNPQRCTVSKFIGPCNSEITQVTVADKRSQVGVDMFLEQCLPCTSDYKLGRAQGRDSPKPVE